MIKQWSKTTRDPLSCHCLLVMAVSCGGLAPRVPRRARFTAFERRGREVDVLDQSCIDELCRRDAATYRRYPLNAFLDPQALEGYAEIVAIQTYALEPTAARGRADSCRAIHSSPAIRNTRTSGTLNNSASKSSLPRFDTTIWAG